jgi:hypothetical protein
MDGRIGANGHGAVLRRQTRSPRDVRSSLHRRTRLRCLAQVERLGRIEQLHSVSEGVAEGKDLVARMI